MERPDLNVELLDGIPPNVVKVLGIREYPGYTGVFTRKNHLGMIRSGTRIKKVVGTPGDRHSLGAKGTVLGSLFYKMPLGYFIEWDDMPKHAVFVMTAIINKIEVVIE